MHRERIPEEFRGSSKYVSIDNSFEIPQEHLKDVVHISRQVFGYKVWPKIYKHIYTPREGYPDFYIGDGEFLLEPDEKSVFESRMFQFFARILSYNDDPNHQYLLVRWNGNVYGCTIWSSDSLKGSGVSVDFERQSWVHVHNKEYNFDSKEKHSS